MDSRLLLAVSVLCGLQVDSQTFPYVSFMENRMPNHSYVNIDLTNTMSSIVKCYTNLTSESENFDGKWYFPNGGVMTSDEQTNISYGPQSVDLHYKTGAVVQSGIYHCTIDVHDGAGSSVAATVYVGIYGSRGK